MRKPSNFSTGQGPPPSLFLRRAVADVVHQSHNTRTIEVRCVQTLFVARMSAELGSQLSAIQLIELLQASELTSLPSPTAGHGLL